MTDGTQTPLAICIFGGAGDLAKKKLIPALFDLYTTHQLPQLFIIIGFGRTERTHDQYRMIVQDILALNAKATQEQIQTFLAHIRYAYTEKTSDHNPYHTLGLELHDFETEVGRSVNRLFYLAIPPSEYEQTFTELYRSKLATVTASDSHFAHILVEKPFGNNYASAVALGELIGTYFDEKQIFRIDHYLAKEAVQNILSFRFANVLLQSAWNASAIQKVHITLKEKLDVDGRAAFYDGVGALKDVGQNHILQMLALIAMEEPKSLSCDDIRTERGNVLQKLRPFTTIDLASKAKKAQYEGYGDVVHHSQTETYFEVALEVDTPTWKGVPFLLRSGKALDEELVQIEVFFKDVATGPFETSSCATVGNKITLTLSPHEQLALSLNVKKPGRKYQVETQTLTTYTEEKTLTNSNAYEKVLLDCIDGDQTVFTTTEEVLASWKWIESLTSVWDVLPIQTYPKGSAGPEDSLFI